MTDEERAGTVRALLDELRGCEQRLEHAKDGDDPRWLKKCEQRVRDVKAALSRLGADGGAPVKRAEKRAEPATA